VHSVVGCKLDFCQVLRDGHLTLFYNKGVSNMAKKSNYDGPYTQRSENNSGYSGLPLKSDGALREVSNAVPPIVKENVKPVNPKD